MKFRIVVLLITGLVMVSAHSHEDKSNEQSDSSESSEEERPIFPGLVHGEPMGHHPPREENPLVRCKRPMCEMFCHHGHQMDEMGCPLCECLEDPCRDDDTNECGAGTVCKAVKECVSFPCTSLAAICIPKLPCAMPQCTIECEHGHVLDKDGCMTCDCKETLCDGHECTQNHKCVQLPSFDCPFRRDDPRCKQHAICLPTVPFFPHENDAPFGNGDHGEKDSSEEDSHWPIIGDIPEPPADMTPSFCEFRKIFSEKFREAVDQQVGRNHTGYKQMMKSDNARTPHCLPNGLFHPIQCNRFEGWCHCVNAMGKKIQGTKTQVKTKEDMPECDTHHVSQATVSMMLTHEFEDVEPHLADIKTTLHAHLSMWLKLDKENIDITELKPATDEEGNNNRLSVEITLHADGVTDLGRSRFILMWHAKQEHGKLPFLDTFLTPDPESIKVDHVSEPMTEDYPIREPDEPKPVIYGCFAYIRHNKKGVIMAGIGAAIFLIVIIAIIIVAVKRRNMRNAQFAHSRMQEKSERYKENLAFTNELYAQMDITGEKKKPLETEEAIKEEEVKEDQVKEGEKE